MAILTRADLERIKPVHPFCPRTVCHGMTYGVGPAGYDIRIKQELFLEPLQCALASSIEHFEMPNDILGHVADKSSWARHFVTVQNTIIEPGWRGYLTLEIINQSWTPKRIHAGSPIAQVVFHTLTSPTEPYEGRYQDQADRPVGAIAANDTTHGERDG